MPGIDTLRYKNAVEGDPIGEMSWITWNPGTLHSRTTGAQLYGVPAAGLTTAEILRQYYADGGADLPRP